MANQVFQKVINKMKRQATSLVMNKKVGLLIILLSHGIFGGYDQGYVSLNQLIQDGYRKIAISRFGYPGSDLPKEPTPRNHAKDDPMAKYENIEKILGRVLAQTAIFETGGHTIEGNNGQVEKAIYEFIERTK